MDLINTLFRHKLISFIKKWNLLGFLLGAIDVISIALAFQFSYLIEYFKTGGFFFSETRLLWLFLLILPFWLLALYLIQVNEIPRTKRYRVLFFEYLQSTVVIIILLLVFYFVFKLYLISRLFLIDFALL